MDMKDMKKVKLFQELLKMIIIVNKRQLIEDINQTECHISNSAEYNYAHYLLYKVANENPTLSFEEHRDIAIKQVINLLLQQPKIINKNYEIEL
jgi:hypothetical protein